MPRYSPQLQQEDISRFQLQERFVKLGWKIDAIPRDVGEDLQGRIFNKGESTGLTFDIQLKSIANPNKRRRKKDQVFSYPIAVADLIHWEVSMLPTIFIVWDINKRTGLWVSIRAVIGVLDATKDGWRTQSTCQIEFPENQNTKDAGMSLLWLLVMQEGQSSIDRWFMKKFDLKFSLNDSTKPDWEKFLHGLETGETIEISGQHLELSERDKRLLGPVKYWEQKITIATAPTGEIIPIRLDVQSQGHNATIPYLEMKIVHMGKSEATLANYHAAFPGIAERLATPFSLSIRERVGETSTNLNISVEGSNPTPTEIKWSLPFLKAMAQGGSISITYLKHDPMRTPQWEDFPPQTFYFPFWFERLIDQACEIELLAKCQFHIKDWLISETEEKNIDLAYNVLKHGISCQTGLPLSIQLNAIELKKSPSTLTNFLNDVRKVAGWASFETDFEEKGTQILGITVSLGICSMKAKGRIFWPEAQLKDAIMGCTGMLHVPLTQTQTVIKSSTYQDTESCD